MAPINANSNNDSTLSTERMRLYRAALNGKWKSIEGMQDIQRRIGIKGETTLHIAVVANQEEFVIELLRWMRDNKKPIAAGNGIGATALNYAAAVGNVKIAEAMLDINTEDPPNIAATSEKPMKPLLMAASLGHGEMVKLLYEKTTNMVENEEAEIFITCVKNNLYEEALIMLNQKRSLARAKINEETALHVLARKPSAFVNESQPGVLTRHINNIPWLKCKQENSKQSVASDLFTKCLEEYKSDVEKFNENPEIPQALFEAAGVGNVEFMVKLIRFDFDILWKTYPDEVRSIFHIAVEKRHESIFNLLDELGSFGNILVQGTTANGSNILHLAAGLAPKEKLNAISGAALQMQRELLWFKEVEKLVSADYIEMKNNKGHTPYVLFAENHEELRRDGEKWMRDTANYSMVVAVLIGSVMFTGQVADGLNKKPDLFLAYSVSSAISLFGSSTSLIMFLSILTSRYSFEDFLVSLPVRLIIGVISLSISIAAMMFSFATSFWLKNYNQRVVIFVFIGLCACVPIMDVLLKCRLVFGIFQSTSFRFRPQHRLLQDEISNAPVRRSQPHAPAKLASIRIEHPPNKGE